MPKPETLIDGLRFPEGPRWREGRLWFSDMHSQQVLAVDLDGATEVVESLVIRRDGMHSEQIFPHYVFREWKYKLDKLRRRV